MRGVAPSLSVRSASNSIWDLRPDPGKVWGGYAVIIPKRLGELYKLSILANMNQNAPLSFSLL